MHPTRCGQTIFRGIRGFFLDLGERPKKERERERETLDFVPHLHFPDKYYLTFDVSDAIKLTQMFLVLEGWYCTFLQSYWISRWKISTSVSRDWGYQTICNHD